jgi:hypothetical protein
VAHRRVDDERRSARPHHRPVHDWSEEGPWAFEFRAHVGAVLVLRSLARKESGGFVRWAVWPSSLRDPAPVPGERLGSGYPPELWPASATRWLRPPRPPLRQDSGSATTNR